MTRCRGNAGMPGGLFLIFSPAQRPNIEHRIQCSGIFTAPPPPGGGQQTARRHFQGRPDACQRTGATGGTGPLAPPGATFKIKYRFLASRRYPPAFTPFPCLACRRFHWPGAASERHTQCRHTLLCMPEGQPNAAAAAPSASLSLRRHLPPAKVL
eukprot:gene15030-biopygen2135